VPTIAKFRNIKKILNALFALSLILQAVVQHSAVIELGILYMQMLAKFLELATK
jgi:hypothetical protein